MNPRFLVYLDTCVISRRGDWRLKTSDAAAMEGLSEFAVQIRYVSSHHLTNEVAQTRDPKTRGLLLLLAATIEKVPWEVPEWNGGVGGSPVGAAKADALRMATAAIERIASEVRNRAIARALGVLRNDQLSRDIQELFLQSLILAWGALEVLANDVFRVLLDSRPDLSSLLHENEECKRLFGGTRLNKAVHSMGTLLLDRNRISNLRAMKSVLSVLFGHDAQLQSALCSCGKEAHRCSQRSGRAGSAAPHHGSPAPALGFGSPDPQESGYRDPTGGILPRGVRREVAGSGRAMELVSSGSASLQQRQASAGADVPLAAGRVFSSRMAGPGALAPPSL
jgi:hypothetical protein